MITLLAKFALPIVIALAAFTGGMITSQRLQKAPVVKIPSCPPCNCPAAVSLQNFDLEKLNNKKGTFTYAPQLHDVRIIIESKDSVLIKQMLKQAK